MTIAEFINCAPQAPSVGTPVVAVLAAVLAAVVSGIVAILVTIGSSMHRSRIERERSDEQVSLKLLERRIEPYTDLMKQLAKVSHLYLGDLDEEGRRAKALEVFNVLHSAIYGPVGVLASTVTRETILCARRRCKGYAERDCDERSMQNAIWAVHQMLRSDLNHHQDRVTREFDRVRSKLDRNMTEDVIEYLVANMPHVQFEAKPRMRATTWWQRRRVERQASRIFSD